jgi:hypothetical protein
MTAMSGAFAAKKARTDSRLMGGDFASKKAE